MHLARITSDVLPRRRRQPKITEDSAPIVLPMERGTHWVLVTSEVAVSILMLRDLNAEFTENISDLYMFLRDTVFLRLA